MKKRFTDTELYDREWFMVLSPKMKCAWEWLCKRCDHIGVWNINMRKMSQEIGDEITLQELTSTFDVEIFNEDKLFISSFVRFQYGDESGRLSPKHKLHLSIAKKLKSHGLPVPEFKPLEEENPNPSSPSREGQGIGIGIGNIKEESEEKKLFDFETPYQNYPRKEGKLDGMIVLRKTILTQEDYDNFCVAVTNYREEVQDRAKDKIKLFSTFVGTKEIPRWRDYIETDKSRARKAKALSREQDLRYQHYQRNMPEDGDLTTLSTERAQKLGLSFHQLEQLVSIWWRDKTAQKVQFSPGHSPKELINKFLNRREANPA